MTNPIHSVHERYGWLTNLACLILLDGSYVSSVIALELWAGSRRQSVWQRTVGLSGYNYNQVPGEI
jgi:hypothetical protein